MKPRLLIAGAGPIGVELAKRAVNQWAPILIENDPARCATAGTIEGAVVHQGDVTSTLVLKRSKVKGVSCAIATTGDDEVNLEFCRLMRESFGAQSLVALARTEATTEALQALGATVIDRSASMAAILEGAIDGGRRAASNVGLGTGEIMQVTVQSHSPVIGKTMSQLRPQSWLLGAIYREGKLVVPHGATAIEPNDKCLLIGDPGVLHGIADYFQRGSSEFPLQYGSRLCLLEQKEGTYPDLQECRWLRDKTESKGFAAVHRSAEPPPVLAETLGQEIETRLWGPETRLPAITQQLDSGVWITTAEQSTWRDKLGVGNRDLFDLLNQTSEPVLISRASNPYKKILVAVSPSPGALRAGELAVDVARKLGADLTAVGVEPADFVVGADYKDKLQASLGAVKAKAHLYSRRIRLEHVEGNPVTKVLEMALDFDLLVVAHRRHRKFSFIRTDVSRYLITGAACSVMVLPFTDADIGA